MAAPFALTYTAPAAELPAWQSYTQSATLTTTALWTVATLDAQGVITFTSGQIVQTAYGTQVVQLPITVDVPYSVGAPYTTPGGTGPTVISVLGATAAITLRPVSQVLSSAAPPLPTVQPSSSVAETTAPIVSTSPPPTSAPIPTTTVESAPTTAPGASTSTLPSSAADPNSAASAASIASVSSSSLSSVSAASSSEPSASAASSRSSASSALPSNSSTRSTAPPSSSSASTLPPSSSLNAPADLSGGQIAGIVVGVLAAVFFLLLLAFCCLRRRKIKRDSSGQAEDWDFLPVAGESTINTGRRRSSATTGTSRGGLWGLAGLVGMGSSGGGSRGGSPTISTGRRGSDEKEKAPLAGAAAAGSVREVREDGEGFEGMAMMDESASPVSIFPTFRPREQEYAQVGGTALGAAGAAGAASVDERGGLLDPFDDRERSNEEDPFQGDYHTPEMPSGWAGAAAATGLLHGVQGDWSGTPSPYQDASPSRRPARVYPSFHISGTSTPPDSPPRPPPRSPHRASAAPLLSEFAWMKGRTSDLHDSSSTRDSGVVGGTHSSGSAGSRLDPSRDSRGSRGTSMNEHSPNISELFYNTPRWLGTRQPSSQDNRSLSFYGEQSTDSPLLYPLAVTNSDPMRSHSRQSSGSNEVTPVKQVRHRNSEGMLDRIAASFNTALSGLGIGARSRENSNESSGAEDRFTSTPTRITPRVLQANLIPTPESTPLRRSLTSATFGGDEAPDMLARAPSPYTSTDERIGDVGRAASAEEGFNPRSLAMERGDARLTATSFGTLGQPLERSRSPSPTEVLSDVDVGAATLGSHSHSYSPSQRHLFYAGSISSNPADRRRQSSSEASGSHETSNGSHSRRDGSGSAGIVPYDGRRNTLGRQLTVSEAGSGASRSRSVRTGEGSSGSGSGHGSGGSSGQHSSGRSEHSHHPPPPAIPESETLRQPLSAF